MARKKWTPKEDITESLLKFREKRKWQLAFRRYILEKNPSAFYAPYFGLDIDRYREWIELQFLDDLNWESFGSKWQFDHIVPVAYFDFSNADDMVLCWNLINIRVEALDINHAQGNRINLIAAKPYFLELFKRTGYSLCLKMLEKLETIMAVNIPSEPGLENFIVDHKNQLEQLSTLSQAEFMQLNQGMALDDIFLEREILRKFG